MRLSILILTILFLQTKAVLHNTSGLLDIGHLSKDFFKDEFIRHIKSISATDKCISKLKTIIGNLESTDPIKFYHSFEVFDAWGKIPSGIAYGHLLHMGNYQQCININYTTYSNFNKQNVEIVGKYCQVITPITWLYLTGSGMGVGVCIPKECSNYKISKLFKNALKNTEVNVVNCSTKDEYKFTVIDYVALVFFGLIGVFVVISTLYGVYSERMKLTKNVLYLSFSIIHNSRKLFVISRESNPNSISCLYGIRSLTMLWVIWGHGFLSYAFFPILNMRKIPNWRTTLSASVLNGASIAVDTFFFLSGLLLAWIGLKEITRNKGKINILMMYAHRILRILPLVGIMMLFVVSFFKFCASGPIWPSLVQYHKNPCERKWWMLLLFIENYGSPDFCLPQAWFLAIDMQLYLISPLILIGLYKWRTKFVIVHIIGIILSLGCIYGVYYKYHFTEISPLFDTNRELRLKTHFQVIQTRYSTWLLGITCGYFMRNFKDKEIKIPRLYNILAWLAALIVMFSLVLGLYPSQQLGYEPTVFEAASYDAFSKVGWSLALSWIIFACHRGYGGLINDFLSHPLWQFMSRLSFCMYVTHVTVQTIIFGNYQSSLYYSDFEMMHSFWVSFGLTIVVSIVMVLICEAPIIAIEKVIFQRKPSASKET